ncbi:hypothetical protein KCU86_g2023, partial [Aureobasidium melanogenum]
MTKEQERWLFMKEYNQGQEELRRATLACRAFVLLDRPDHLTPDLGAAQPIGLPSNLERAGSLTCCCQEMEKSCQKTQWDVVDHSFDRRQSSTGFSIYGLFQHPQWTLAT